MLANLVRPREALAQDLELDSHKPDYRIAGYCSTGYRNVGGILTGGMRTHIVIYGAASIGLAVRDKVRVMVRFWARVPVKVSKSGFGIVNLLTYVT